MPSSGCWAPTAGRRTGACGCRVLPFGGLKATFEDWVTTESGAQIATSHRMGLVDVRVRGLRAVGTLEALDLGPDPFDRLLNW